jgi:hypothetical protein
MRIGLKEILVEKTNAEKRPGQIGRYSASAIWGINNNYTSVKQFIEGEEFDFKSAFRIWQGTWKHKQLEELLEWKGYKIEEKKEIEIEVDDVKFTLVGKADIQDLVEKNDVCDFKTSETLTAEAKPWSIHQLQMYCHVFNKPVAYIVEPRKSDNNFWLEVIGRTLRDEDFFWQEMKKLANFHRKLLKNYANLL